MKTKIRFLFRFFFLYIFLFCGLACTDEQNTTSTYFKPQIGNSFEWRLDSIGLDEVKDYHCNIIDIDAFSASKELVDAFHKQGIKVIAYISVGTIENFRPDAALLPAEVIGNIYPDWPDERFLNIRDINKLKPFIQSRFDMIKAKGFDGIEPDNMDGYNEDNGFNLTVEDTQQFCEWIIEEAHSRGLCIGQKNTEELVPLMHQKFDFALTEDIFNMNTQTDYMPYISVGKPVFSAEYTDVMSPADFSSTVCPKAKTLNYFAFLKHRDLTRWTYDCN